MLAIHEFGAGPAVVLVHGIPGSAATWRPVAQRLAIDHRVLVPDLLGFGATGGDPHIGQLGADAQAAALAAALDILDVTAATVVGHDFGGPVALHLLNGRPDLVGALGLLATNAFSDTAIPFPLSSVTWPVVGPAASRLLFSRPSLRLLTRRMVGTPRVRLDPRDYVGDAAQARAIRLIFTDSLANLAERYLPFEAILSGVNVPAAVIWGDCDPFFPLAHGTRTAAALGVDLRVLSSAGHALPEERPDEVAAAIAALDQRASPGDQRLVQPVLEREAHPEVGRQAEGADQLSGPARWSSAGTPGTNDTVSAPAPVCSEPTGFLSPDRRDHRRS